MKTLAMLLLALSGATIAVAEPMNLDPLPSPPPEVRRDGQVSFLNGGVGEEEVRWFKSQSTRYPLQVIISGRGGEYGVADLLSVKRGNEQLVSLADAGPWVMFDLPPGRYSVEATFDGRTERRSVQVPDHRVQRVNWNTPKASE